MTTRVSLRRWRSCIVDGFVQVQQVARALVFHLLHGLEGLAQVFRAELLFVGVLHVAPVADDFQGAAVLGRAMDADTVLGVAAVPEGGVAALAVSP
jgi:hypothetical protein